MNMKPLNPIWLVAGMTAVVLAAGWVSEPKVADTDLFGKATQCQATASLLEPMTQVRVESIQDTKVNISYMNPVGKGRKTVVCAFDKGRLLDIWAE